MNCCVCGGRSVSGTELCLHHCEMRRLFGPMYEEIGVDFEVSLDRPVSDEGVEEPKMTVSG